MFAYQRVVRRGGEVLSLQFIQDAPFLPREKDRINTEIGPAIVDFIVFNEVEVSDSQRTVSVSVYATLMSDREKATQAIAIESNLPNRSDILPPPMSISVIEPGYYWATAHGIDGEVMVHVQRSTRTNVLEVITFGMHDYLPLTDGDFTFLRRIA